jgi:hypothetical protein
LRKRKEKGIGKEKGMEGGKKEERDGKGKEEGGKRYGRWRERGKGWERKRRGRKKVGKEEKRERVDKGEGIKLKCGDGETDWKGKRCERWK